MNEPNKKPEQDHTVRNETTLIIKDANRMDSQDFNALVSKWVHHDNLLNERERHALTLNGFFITACTFFYGNKVLSDSPTFLLGLGIILLLFPPIMFKYFCKAQSIDLHYRNSQVFKNSLLDRFLDCFTGAQDMHNVLERFRIRLLFSIVCIENAFGAILIEGFIFSNFSQNSDFILSVLLRIHIFLILFCVLVFIYWVLSPSNPENKK